MQFGKWNRERPLRGSARRWAVWGCAGEGRGTVLRKSLGVIAREHLELHQSLLGGLRDHRSLKGLRPQKSFLSFETHLLYLHWSRGFATRKKSQLG